MTFENKLKELKINLPNPASPVGSYVATKIVGKLIYISGQISMDEKGELIKGKLGKNLKTELDNTILKVYIENPIKSGEKIV